MRNYLYIPLGGNRVNNKARLYLNLWLVFLASGLWHGAAWGYVIWGAYHGLFLVMERLFLGRWLQKTGKLSVLYTFLVVTVGWVFFKTEHAAAAWHYLRVMFSAHHGASLWIPNREQNIILLFAILFSFFTLSGWGARIQQQVYFKAHSIRMHVAMTCITTALFILSASQITQSTFNPFIYFRF